jgi:hypothetical protein
MNADIGASQHLVPVPLSVLNGDSKYNINCEAMKFSDRLRFFVDSNLACITVLLGIYLLVCSRIAPFDDKSKCNLVTKKIR